MKNKSAFTLVDVMMTLLVLLIGTGAVLGIMERSRQALAVEQDRQTATRILARLNTLPVSILLKADQKTYDFRGLRDGPGSFRVRVRSEPIDENTLWHFRVEWSDSGGVARSFDSEKLTWGAPQ